MGRGKLRWVLGCDRLRRHDRWHYPRPGIRVPGVGSICLRLRLAPGAKVLVLARLGLFLVVSAHSTPLIITTGQLNPG